MDPYGFVTLILLWGAIALHQASCYDYMGNYRRPPLEMDTPVNIDQTCRCGQGKEMPKVIGGYAAVKNSRPWMAALFRSGQFFCGGALINDRDILTASHCADDAPTGNMTVRLGAHMLNESEPNAVDRQVALITMHPDFNPNTLVNDIAILRMSTPVTFNEYISPICLPPSDAGQYEWEWAILDGWGLTTYMGTPSPYLKETTVQIQSNLMCQIVRPVPQFTIQPSNICANKPGWITYEGACNGDSGSALIVFNAEKEQWDQVGIVSYGTGLDCGNPYTPDIYSRVTSFKEFIRKNTPEAIYCNGTSLN